MYWCKDLNSTKLQLPCRASEDLNFHFLYSLTQLFLVLCIFWLSIICLCIFCISYEPLWTIYILTSFEWLLQISFDMQVALLPWPTNQAQRPYQTVLSEGRGKAKEGLVERPWTGYLGQLPLVIFFTQHFWMLLEREATVCPCSGAYSFVMLSGIPNKKHNHMP